MRPEEIVVSAAHLRDGALSVARISLAELSLARGVIEPGHREPVRAVPQDPLTQHPADFPCTTDPWVCKWCNYGELRGRRTASLGR